MANEEMPTRRKAAVMGSDIGPAFLGRFLATGKRPRIRPSLDIIPQLWSGTKGALTAYFGRRLGSPPGLPGGGITGVFPTSGVGARISGSTPAGGHNTPSDFASFSPSGSARPAVESSGAMVLRGLSVRIGAQLVAAAAGAV